MPSRFESYRMVDGKTPLAAGYFNPVLQELDLRLVGLEELRVSWLDAVAQVQELGLARINELVGAPMETVNQAITDIEQRLAVLPQMVSQDQVTTQLQAAMAAEAQARTLLQQRLEQLRQTVNEIQGVDLFPSMDGKAGQFLSNDGTARVWDTPSVTALKRGSAQPQQLLGIDDAGKIVGMVPVRRLDYSERANLRSLATGTAMVRGLGVFEWDTTVDAADVDDDATLFRATGGCWRMLAADPEAVVRIAQLQLDGLASQFLQTTFGMSLTSLASQAEVVFDVPLPGVSEDCHAFVTPGKAFAPASERPKLSHTAWIEADGVRVSLRNHGSTVAELTPGAWTVLCIKPAINPRNFK